MNVDSMNDSATAPVEALLKTRYVFSLKLFEIFRNVTDRHGGDFQEYIILYALLLASDYHHINANSSDTANSDPRRHKGVNLLSIAEITGIPRETVRRKVAKLVAEGSVTRRDDGLHYYSGNSSQDDITIKILKALPTLSQSSASLPSGREASAYEAPPGGLRTIGIAGGR